MGRTEDRTAPHRALARRCADSDLRLRDALALHDAMYRADALRMTRGNITGAAKIAGVNREAFSRMVPRARRTPEGQDG